ncbi:DUF2974 domain-containing protein [Bacillus sp. CLL-7-23]|uniref:DUF2974 domain-containing protein n=1 Tax=Bacillus changyiensis TaxID=3004103 RepID=A0ABT4X2A9_9BACI|nr:Mbeg1-like protein [Bacillus changyiensis]MDA7026232.1 DUF2974 domain-containing protein [Bacillus changyiensis]
MSNKTKNAENKRPISQDKNLVELAGYHAYNMPDEKESVYVNEYKYTVVNKIKDNKNGLDAMTVKNLETGEYTIVYQGTNLDNGDQDLDADKDLAIGRTHEQFKAARDYFDKIKKEYGDKLTSVCGNSLGGGLANYVAVKHSDLKCVTINPSVLPEGEVDHDEDYPNITNYFSKYDPLTSAETGAMIADRIPGKVIEIDNGVPLISSILSNHMGYKMGEIDDKDQTVEIGEEGEPGHGKVYVSASDHIVTSIWTGEPLYGNIGSTKIEINKASLDLLAKSLETDVMRRLGYVSEYIENSNEIVKHEQKMKPKRKADLQEKVADFFESAFGDPLFTGITQAANLLKSFIDQIIDWVDMAEEKFRSLNSILNSPPAELIEHITQTDISVESICDGIRGFLRDIKDGIDDLSNVLKGLITEGISHVFVNPVNGLTDAVADEVYKHLVIVGKNEKQLKSQLSTFIKQVNAAATGFQNSDQGAANDIRNRKAPKEQKTSVPASVQAECEQSDYLKDRLKVKAQHVDSSLLNFLSSVSLFLNPVLGSTYRTLVVFEAFMEKAIIDVKAVAVAGSIPDKLIGLFTDWDGKIEKSINGVVKDLEQVESDTEKYRKGVESITQCLSNLPLLIKEFKPYIDTAIFEPLGFSNINIYNTAAVSTLEETELLFLDIVYQLSDHKGKAIQALCHTAEAIVKTLRLFRDDVSRATM